MIIFFMVIWYTCIFRRPLFLRDRYSAHKSSPKPDFPPEAFFSPEGLTLCSRNTIAQRHVKSGFRFFPPA